MSMELESVLSNGNRLNAYFPPKLIYWNPNPEGDGIRKWGLWGDEITRQKAS